MKSFVNNKNVSKRVPEPPTTTSVVRQTQGAQLINWTVTVWPHLYTSLELCYDAVLALSSVSRYTCFGMETCPDTKREHLQGFVVLEKRMRLSELKKLDSTMHFEAMRGTLEQNWDYCTKEDKEPMEFGERPDFTAGAREKNRWRLARELATKSEYELIDDQIYVTAYTALHKMKYDNVGDETPLQECCGIWLYGVPASGKSFDARTRYGNNNFYIKESFDQWFDGYTGQDSIIIEDVDPDMCDEKRIVQRLKTWTDKWPFPVQTKGGMINAIRPQRIIVTSNFSIDECFPKATGSNLEAIKRRFKVIHYAFPYAGSLTNLVVSVPPGTLAIFNQITAERRDFEEMRDERSFHSDSASLAAAIPVAAVNHASPGAYVTRRSPPGAPSIVRRRAYIDPTLKKKIKVIDLSHEHSQKDVSDSDEESSSSDSGDEDETASLDCCSDCGYVEDDCVC